MKKKINFPLILLIASLGTALLAVIARSILTQTQLDVKYGVYARDTILPTVFHIALAVILTALVFISLATAPKHSKEYTCPNSNSGIFISSTIAFLLVADILFSLYYIYKHIEETKNISPELLEKMTLLERLPLFDILELVFCIPAIIFFLSFIFEKVKVPAARAFCSFFPTAWCTVCLIRIYFDTTVLNTSPSKTLFEIALLAAMLYFLNESRSLLGIFSHRFYLATATVAPVLLFTSAIPSLLFPTKLLIGESDSFLRCTICAAFAVFIWIRYGAYVSSLKKADTE
ncbi:MAG: hypothetical protein IJY93_03320 [Clostridia bacterium]|nr:hypothetical protein [Clostridia bacterium]